MIESDEIIRLITKALPDAIVEVHDLRGDGEHYAAYVESEAFYGKSRIEQHQMVFTALQGGVGGALRGLTLKTAIPPEEP
jgi:stress-induced morphogen